VVNPEQDKTGCITTIKAAVREGGLSLTLLSSNLADVFLIHNVLDVDTKQDLLRACGLAPITLNGVVTFSPPDADETGCIEVIHAFVRGGGPGLRCLLKVLPNVFKSHHILDVGMQREILRACDLASIHDGGDGAGVSFVIPESENSPPWTRINRHRVEREPVQPVELVEEPQLSQAR
jgi:hypothetical protein